MNITVGVCEIADNSTHLQNQNKGRKLLAKNPQEFQRFRGLLYYTWMNCVLDCGKRAWRRIGMEGGNGGGRKTTLLEMHWKWVNDSRYRNKQSYSSNKINAALPDQQLVFSRVLYTQSYTNTHPFDDLVNSITCNLFCAEIGIYPSFPFLFPTDNEFVTATSWIGLGSPSSHTTIFCLSFKPHTNLSFSSSAIPYIWWIEFTPSMRATTSYINFSVAPTFAWYFRMGPCMENFMVSPCGLLIAISTKRFRSLSGIRNLSLSDWKDRSSDSGKKPDFLPNPLLQKTNTFRNASLILIFPCFSVRVSSIARLIDASFSTPFTCRIIISFSLIALLVVVELAGLLSEVASAVAVAVAVALVCPKFWLQSCSASLRAVTSTFQCQAIILFVLFVIMETVVLYMNTLWGKKEFIGVIPDAIFPNTSFLIP